MRLKAFLTPNKINSCDIVLALAIDPYPEPAIPNPEAKGRSKGRAKNKGLIIVIE